MVELFYLQRCVSQMIGICFAAGSVSLANTLCESANTVIERLLLRRLGFFSTYNHIIYG